MKKQKFVLPIAICGLLSFVPSASASSCSWQVDDYPRFEEKLNLLEKQTGMYEEIRKILEKDRESGEKKYGICISNASKKWMETWKYMTNDAETARKKIEKYNDGLKKFNNYLKDVNNKLEKKRSDIENSHKIKNEEYRKKIRDYMCEMETKYFHRLKTELFSGYEKYIDCMKPYNDFISAAAKDCQNKDYTRPERDWFPTFLPQVESNRLCETYTR